MKNSYLLFLILLIILVTNLDASEDNWDQKLYDSVRYAEDGNTQIVDLEQIKLSLANGANRNWIKSRERKDESILSHYVTIISWSDNPDTIKKGLKAIKMLFEHGAKLQYCDGAILYFPIADGKYDIVKLLLENGASATFWPKHEIGGSITPIEVATKNGHEPIIDLLISYGAKRLSEKDAVQAIFIEVARLGSINELKSLLNKGAKINERNNQKETALLNALGGFYDRYSTYFKIIFLLDMGTDVNQRGKGTFGMTFPLHEAIYYSSFLFNSKTKKDTSYAKEILQQLIKRGAYVASENEDGRTPLHVAAERNHIYAAQLLLDSGSKVMPKDKTGKTPLDNAKSAEMIKLLKKYGAKEQ